MKKQKHAAIQMLAELYNSRKMILKLAKNDFRTKYAGSYLGILWAFVQPVVTILLYWFVFQIGFRSRDVGGYPFVLWLIAGLVPWFYFNDAWTGATSGMLDYDFLVKKVVFNIGILPVIKICSAFFVNAFFLVLMIVIFAINGYFPTVYTLQLFYCLICTTALVWGLGYFTSSLVVFVRDLRHFLTVVLQVLMWMTPIMWNISMVEGKFPWLANLLRINPVYYIVQMCRNAMFGEGWFWEEASWTIYFWILVIVFFISGASVFQKLRVHFADVM